MTDLLSHELLPLHGPPEPEYIGDCHHCRIEINEGITEYRDYTSEDSEIAGDTYICLDCESERSPKTCWECGIPAEATTYPMDRTSRHYCDPCRMNHLNYCYDCSEYFVDGFHDGERCDECWTCECYQCGCEDCYGDSTCGDCSECEEREDESSGGVIHSYSYKPSPKFHTVDGWDYYQNSNLNVPFFGLELEITTSSKNAGPRLVTDFDPDLIYCKDDSTVEGFEMVTHPMTLEAAKSKLPFDELHVLRNEHGASGWNNGIHVHVSRSGFTNDLHVFRWMKLFYRNPDAIRRIARRDSERWAPFNDREAKNHPQVGKSRNARYADRYSAINTTNSSTFEVRVFRGSLRKDEILASIELVAASVEYARQLTTDDIRNRDGWGWSRFIEWADSQGDTYRNLVELDAKTRPIEYEQSRIIPRSFEISEHHREIMARARLRMEAAIREQQRIEREREAERNRRERWDAQYGPLTTTTTTTTRTEVFN